MDRVHGVGELLEHEAVVVGGDRLRSLELGAEVGDHVGLVPSLVVAHARQARVWPLYRVATAWAKSPNSTGSGRTVPVLKPSESSRLQPTPARPSRLRIGCEAARGRQFHLPVQRRPVVERVVRVGGVEPGRFLHARRRDLDQPP